MNAWTSSKHLAINAPQTSGRGGVSEAWAQLPQEKTRWGGGGGGGREQNGDKYARAADWWGTTSDECVGTAIANKRMQDGP
jgi:hypothetical protein